MIDYVIDANVLMSILISGKSAYRPILAFNNFILPDFALIEINKYQSVIKSKTKMSEDQLIKWSYLTFSHITILPKYILSVESITKAENLLEKIDLKDMSYVALSNQLNLPLLTRDFLLYQGLKRQGFKKVKMFEDFLDSL